METKGPTNELKAFLILGEYFRNETNECEGSYRIAQSMMGILAETLNGFVIYESGLWIVDFIASFMHEQWAHWTDYLLENMDDENEEMWKRKMKTPFKDLTEQEKESDRKWARKMLKHLGIELEG